MKRLGNFVAAAAVLGFVVFGMAGLADAQRRNEREIRDLVRTLNAQIDEFQYGLDNQQRSMSQKDQDDIDALDSIRDLQTKVDDMQENLNNGRDNRDDIREILAAANNVDAYVLRSQPTRRVGASWRAVRTTIDTLASNYGVTPKWTMPVSSIPGIDDGDGTTVTTTTRNGNRTTTTQRTDQSGSMVRIIPPTGRTVPNNRTIPDDQTMPDRTPTYRSVPNRTIPAPTVPSNGLSGTYQIDPARSEVIADIIAGANVGADQRQELESKLEAPDQITIDIRGNEVTLSSSKASAVTFVADGREKTEQSNGRTVRIRATLRSDELTITSLGGETDYTVTFAPQDDGRTMKVTRRITTDYLSETIFAESIYNKTGAGSAPANDRTTAGTYSDNDNSDYSSNDPADRNGNPSLGQSRTGQFLVPSGTLVTGFLETPIDTKVTKNNDRFRMTVQSPDEFRGATVEGYVTGVGRSGKVSGRSNVTLNFESITLRNGDRYDFAGYLQSVRDHNGRIIKIDSEGSVKGSSQAKQTAKRGGIGAGIGAVIGAIMGGGTGAAIGAAIGGGAGAGSVIVQGRDDLQLMKGTMITVQSTSRAGNNRRVDDH